jgi:hypothetical protein
VDPDLGSGYTYIRIHTDSCLNLDPDSSMDLDHHVDKLIPNPDQDSINGDS